MENFSFCAVKTMKINPSMYDPYHPIKLYSSQKILCYHVYQFPEAAV